MAYWLFKTEPETFSWEMQKERGAKGEPWSGVRNFQAAANMKAMKKGDLGFFYHTGEERQVVGIVEVIGEYRKDPTDETGRFGLVDVKAVEDFKTPVTLAAAVMSMRPAIIRVCRLEVLMLVTMLSLCLVGPGWAAFTY